jgi:hypothetical protein
MKYPKDLANWLPGKTGSDLNSQEVQKKHETNVIERTAHIYDMKRHVAKHRNEVMLQSGSINHRRNEQQ